MIALLALLIFVPCHGRCGLVAWWPFQEGAGTTTTDTVGGRGAAFNGHVAWASSPAPTAYLNPYAVSFDDLIDEVGIWNRALAPDEIAYLYNSGHGHLIIPEPATVAIVLCGLAFLKAEERLRRSKQGE